MKLDCKFTNVDWSESLAEYAQQKFEKISKIELKPLKGSMVVSHVRNKKNIEICVHAFGTTFRAQSSAGDFYEAVDGAFHKIKNQLVKKKNKIQRHRHYSHSKEAKIMRLNEQLEMEAYKDIRKVS